MSVLVRELDSFLNETVFGNNKPANYHTWSDETGYTLQVPMVGVTKEELKVEAQNGTLFVESKPTTNKSVFVHPYKGHFYFAKDADVDAIEAKLENGLLTVKVPKAKTNRKSITVI